MTNVTFLVKNNPFRSNINLEYTFSECIFTESVEILRIQQYLRYWACSNFAYIYFENSVFLNTGCYVICVISYRTNHCSGHWVQQEFLIPK